MHMSCPCHVRIGDCARSRSPQERLAAHLAVAVRWARAITSNNRQGHRRCAEVPGRRSRSPPVCQEAA